MYSVARLESYLGTGEKSQKLEKEASQCQSWSVSDPKYGIRIEIAIKDILLTLLCNPVGDSAGPLTNHSRYNYQIDSGAVYPRYSN